MNDSETNERRDRVLKTAFQHREALLTQAFVMLRDWAAAEDVVQDAFLVVVNKYEDFEEGSSVYAWTRQIVRNKTLEALRKRTREVPTEDENLEAAVSAALEEQLTEEMADSLQEQHQALTECMSHLRKQSVDMLVGFYSKLESCDIIARAHKRSANSVRLLLSRARRELRDCVDRKLRVSMA